MSLQGVKEQFDDAIQNKDIKGFNDLLLKDSFKDLSAKAVLEIISSLYENIESSKDKPEHSHLLEMFNNMLAVPSVLQILIDESEENVLLTLTDWIVKNKYFKILNSLLQEEIIDKINRDLAAPGMEEFISDFNLSAQEILKALRYSRFDFSKELVGKILKINVKESAVSEQDQRIYDFIKQIRDAQERGVTEELQAYVNKDELDSVFDFVLLGFSEAGLILLNDVEKDRINKRLGLLEDQEGIKEQAKKQALAIYYSEPGEPFHIVKDLPMLARSFEVLTLGGSNFDIVLSAKRKKAGYASSVDKISFKDLHLKVLGGGFKGAGKPALGLLNEKPKRYLQLMIKGPDWQMSELEKAAKNEILIPREINSEYVDCPNIGKGFTKGKTAKVGFYTIEANGGTLADFIEKRKQEGKPLLRAEQDKLIRDLLLGMKDIHAKGYVHQDIKPQNMLVDIDPDGNLKLRISDFGISTKEGVGKLGGTGGYFSPEKIEDSLKQGGAPNKAHDMWAVGVSIWQIRNNITDISDTIKSGVNFTDIDEQRKIDAIRELVKADPLVSELLKPEAERINVEQALKMHGVYQKPSRPPKRQAIQEQAQRQEVAERLPRPEPVLSSFSRRQSISKEPLEEPSLKQEEPPKFSKPPRPPRKS